MIVMHALWSPELCLHLLDLVVAAVLDVYVHPVVWQGDSGKSL